MSPLRLIARDELRLMLRNRVAVIAFALLVLLTLVAVVTSWSHQRGAAELRATLELAHDLARAPDHVLGQPGEARHVDEAGRRILARAAQQQVVGLVPAQHVVDQVGIDGELPAAFLQTRLAALDQPGDDRDDDRGENCDPDRRSAR